MSLGNGKPQFTVTTRVQGNQIGEQAIHDPFIHTCVRLRGLRHAWNALTKGLTIEVSVDATHGAISNVMMLDPEKIEADTTEFLAQMAVRRGFNAQYSIVSRCIDSQPN